MTDFDLDEEEQIAALIRTMGDPRGIELLRRWVREFETGWPAHWLRKEALRRLEQQAAKDGD